MEILDISTLTAAVRARAPGAPLDRVEAAIAVGEELASGGDELIGRFVAEAREAGCSWTEIGQRMGVSKQAARQRFTQQPATPAAAGLVPGGRLAPKGRLLACLEAAGREAAADGAAEIGTHHLLVGCSRRASRRRSWRSWACGPTRCAPRRASCFPAPGSRGRCRRRGPRRHRRGGGAGPSRRLRFRGDRAPAWRAGPRSRVAGPPGPGQPRSQHPGDQEGT